jgi:8-oxo-(d)GTP phosphatase
MNARGSVRAAGGVVWRHGEAVGAVGAVEVIVVHRPRYGDWSLPKGKLHRAEHPIVAACREVLEETGLRARVGARLPTVGYLVQAGPAMVDKVVDYWAMTVVADHGPPAGEEIDAVRWLSVEQALARLTYSHDRQVVSAFADLPPLAGQVIVLRHAQAGQRAAWSGAACSGAAWSDAAWSAMDALRPLDSTGVAQAARLADLVRWFWPTRLISASPLRCRQTLLPLSERLGVPVMTDPAFDELADPTLAAERVLSLRDTSAATVVCSQRGLITAMMAELSQRPASQFRTPKGTGWVLSFASDRHAIVDALRSAP